MNSEATGAIGAVQFLAPLQEIKMDAGAAPPADFASWIDRELSRVNEKISSAEIQARKLAAGETDNLHQVMIAMEEAKLSFQLALQVRNRLLESYQEILRMQI